MIIIVANFADRAYRYPVHYILLLLEAVNISYNIVFEIGTLYIAQTCERIL